MKIFSFSDNVMIFLRFVDEIFDNLNSRFTNNGGKAYSAVSNCRVGTAIYLGKKFQPTRPYQDLHA